MRCVNWLLVPALALLVACSGQPSKPAPESTPEFEIPEGTPTGAIVRRTPSANPYDASPEPNNPQVYALFEKAREAMAKQQWGKAEPLLLQAIALAPDYSGLYYNLGRVYEGLQRPADAAQQYDNAIGMNGANIYAMNAAARLKREQGQFAEAEALYKQALAVWPDHANSYRNLGILYDLYMGRLADALAQYRQFQALQVEDDRLVNAWIVDLERRLPAEPAPEAAAPAAEAVPASTEESAQ